MSPNRRSQIQSITLVLSVAILALVFGVMLDDKVVPETKQQLMTEKAIKEAADRDSNKTAKAATEKKQTLQEQAQERREIQAGEIKQLDQKAEVTVEKAERLISQTDEIISKAGLAQQPTASKQISPENKKITKRLADARSRLDALKK